MGGVGSLDIDPLPEALDRQRFAALSLLPSSAECHCRWLPVGRLQRASCFTKGQRLLGCWANAITLSAQQSFKQAFCEFAAVVIRLDPFKNRDQAIDVLVPLPLQVDPQPKQRGN